MVEARSGAEAIDTMRHASAGAEPPHSVWAVLRTAIRSTGDNALIWRLTDQSYRLARGYAKVVRTKWARIRAGDALERYERDDLKETF